MKLLIAKVHGVEVDRKEVAVASTLAMYLFKFEASRRVAKKFREDVRIEVK